MSEMTDDELIGYCLIHCRTERALFHKDQINRMIALAGFPEGFPESVDIEWQSVHEPMKVLCDLATQIRQNGGVQLELVK